MDAISSTVVPLVVAGTLVVGGAYIYQRLNNKKVRFFKSKTTQDTRTPVSDEDLLPSRREKKKKNSSAQTQKQKRARVELTAVESDDEDTASPEPEPVEEKETSPEVQTTIAESTKKGKKAKKAPAEVKETKPKELTPQEREQQEILALRKRIEELEARERGELPTKKDTSKKSSKTVPAQASPSSSSTSSDVLEGDDDWVTIEERKRRPKKSSKSDAESFDFTPLTTTGEVVVPADKRFVIVGRQGQLLNDITELTKVKIDIPRVTAPTAPNAVLRITLTGNPDGIEKAKTIINDLITRGYSADLTPDKGEVKIRVDRPKRGAILADKGAHVRKIIEVTGCTIHIPNDDDEDDVLKIVGDKDQVLVAREAIVSLIRDGFSDLTHEGWTKIQVTFPAEHRRHLIGPNARVIQAIQGSSGCKLNIPDDADKEYVLIIGPSDQVYDAADDVKKVLDKINAPVEDVFATGFSSKDFSKNELW